MALTNAPSGGSENQDAIKLGAESQNRINETADKAIAIIEHNGEKENVIRDILQKQILNTILKNPLMVQSVLDEVDRRFQDRLRSLSPMDRLSAIQGYSSLTEQLGHDIAKKTLNMPLENALNAARIQLELKTESLKHTYQALEFSLKQEIDNTPAKNA